MAENQKITGLEKLEKDPIITQSYQAESDAFQLHKQQEYADWKTAYNQTIAAPRYNANPRLAEIKRKEALWKNLFAGIGTLFADKTPVQDYRADIYQTRNQADAIEQSEKAKEAKSQQDYLEKLHKIWSARPKYEQDEAMRLLNEYNAGLQKENTKEKNAYLRLLKQHEFNAAEKQKDRDAAKALNAANNATRLKTGKKETTKKPYTTVYIDLNDGMGKQSIPMDEGKFHYLANVIAKERGFVYGSDDTKNDPDIKLLRDAMGDGQLSKDSWGKLLAKYPDLIRNAVYEMVYGTATGTGSYIPDTIRRPEYQSATIDSNGKDWSNGNPYLPKYTPTPTPDKKKKKIDIEGDQI